MWYLNGFIPEEFSKYELETLTNILNLFSFVPFRVCLG